VTVTEGLLLPQTIAVNEERDPEIWKLTEKYYDHDIYEQLGRTLVQTRRI
jgi:hypothetical protein